MEGPRGYYANWNISEKAKWFHSYVQSEKQNQHKNQSRKRVTQAEDKPVVARGRKRGGEIKKVTFPLPNKRVTKIKCTARGIQSIRHNNFIGWQKLDFLWCSFCNIQKVSTHYVEY